jgi:hypothetical protein
MAYQPLNYNTMPPALYTMGQPVEDEEQRRRREALEALARGESPTPVKQTITTDPVTGEQKMKIEGSVQDLSAANTMTPTVTGPAVPGMMDQTGPSQDEIMRDQAMAQLGGITPVEPAQMPAMAQPQPQAQPQPEPQVNDRYGQPQSSQQPQPQVYGSVQPQLETQVYDRYGQPKPNQQSLPQVYGYIQPGPQPQLQVHVYYGQPQPNQVFGYVQPQLQVQQQVYYNNNAQLLQVPQVSSS